MAGFHHPRNPYFPKQGNAGWLKPEPEEELEEELEEESEEEPEEGPAELVVDFEEEELNDSDGDESDIDSEVINPPYVARVPAHRMGPNGPTPPWAHEIWRWSRHQGMRPPFGMDRGFYDLSHRGPADRALPFMVRWT